MVLMVLKVYQLKEKFTIETIMSLRSKNKWWTFNKKQINLEIKLKLLTRNNNFIINFKKDSKPLQIKSEIFKGNLPITISHLISLESILDLKMLKLPINMSKIKMKNSKLNLMMSFFKEKKLNKRLKPFKIN